MSGGTFAVSWGRYGGFYWTGSAGAWRLCLGSVAVTYLGMEIDDLMHAAFGQIEAVERRQAAALPSAEQTNERRTGE